MRLKPALLVFSLISSVFADPQSREPTRSRAAALQRTAQPAPLLGMMAARQIRASADAFRAQGDYEAALEAYQSEMTLTGETADCWKHIGWTQKALRRFADAEASLRRATDLDPNDPAALARAPPGRADGRHGAGHVEERD
jgi:tetratricopeptide (TPR) repeat protein